MDLEPPREVVELLTVMGFHWPTINEQDFTTASTVASSLSFELNDLAGDVSVAFARISPSISSEAFSALQTRWVDEAGPRFNDVARALADISNACAVAAAAITSVKVEILGRAGMVLAEFGVSQAAAVFAGAATGGPGAILVEGAEQAFLWGVRETIGRVFNDFEKDVIDLIIYRELGGARTDLVNALGNLISDALVGGVAT